MVVVTVALSGIPRYVTLVDLARNLDQLFDEGDIGGFNARDLPPHPRTNKRRVALDFSSGYDAIAAQEILNNYRYELTDGTHYTLRAKITRDPELTRTYDNMANYDRNPESESALVPFSNQLNTDIRNDENSDSLEERYITLKKELRKLKKKKKVAKLKKKINNFKKNDESRSNSSSPSVSPQRRKAIKSKNDSSSPSSQRSLSSLRETENNSSRNESGCPYERRSTTKRSRNHSRESRSTSTELYRKNKKSKRDDSLDRKKTSRGSKEYRRSRSNERRRKSPAANPTSYRRHSNEKLSPTTRRSPNHRRSPNSRWAPEYRRSPNARRSLYNRRSPESRRLQSPERRSSKNRRRDSSQKRKSLDYSHSQSPRRYSPINELPKRYDLRGSRSSPNYAAGSHKSEIIYVDRSRDVAQMRWEQPSTSKADYYRKRNIENCGDHHSPAQVIELDGRSPIMNPTTFEDKMWSTVSSALDNFPKSDDEEKSDSSTTTQKINIVISVTKNKSTPQIETQNSDGVVHKPIKEEPDVKEEIEDESIPKIKFENDIPDHPHSPKDTVATSFDGRNSNSITKIKSEKGTKEETRKNNDNLKTSHSNSAVKIHVEHEMIDLSNNSDDVANNVVESCTHYDTGISTQVSKNAGKEPHESDIDNAINELANLVSIEVPVNEAKTKSSKRKNYTDANKEVPVKIQKESSNDRFSISNFSEKSDKGKSKPPKIKRICENPKFVLSILVIMRKMLPHLSRLNLDKDLRGKYLAVAKLALRYRIRVLLKHRQDYLDKNDIVKLYRKNFPEQDDKEFVENIIADIQAGKYAEIEPEETCKKKKKVRDKDENTDPEPVEDAKAGNDPNTNCEQILPNVGEPDVNNLKLQLKPALTDSTNNKESNPNSTETVNIKIEKDISVIPKTLSDRVQNPKTSGVDIKQEKTDHEKDMSIVSKTVSDRVQNPKILGSRSEKTARVDIKEEKTDHEKDMSIVSKTVSDRVQNPKILGSRSEKTARVDIKQEKTDHEKEMSIVSKTVSDRVQNPKILGSRSEKTARVDIKQEKTDHEKEMSIVSKTVSDRVQNPKILGRNKNNSSSSEKAARVDVKQEKTHHKKRIKIEKDQNTDESSKSKSVSSNDKGKKEKVLEQKDKNYEKPKKTHKKSKNKKDKTQDKEHKRSKPDQNDRSKSEVKSSNLADDSNPVKTMECSTKNSENIDDDVVIIPRQVPIIDLSDNDSLFKNNKEEKSIEPPNVCIATVEKVFKKEKGVPEKDTDSNRQAPESCTNPEAKTTQDTSTKFERNLNITKKGPKDKIVDKKSEPKNKKDNNKKESKHEKGSKKPKDKKGNSRKETKDQVKRSDKITSKEGNDENLKTSTINDVTKKIDDVSGDNLNVKTPKVEKESEESNQNIEKFVSLMTTITEID